MPKLRTETYAARQQHILDAARVCFSRKGFHAASMIDLQEEAGVSAGAIYIYFSSKDDIVAAITADSLRRVVDTLTGTLECEPTPSFRDALVAVLRSIHETGKGPARGIAFDVWSGAVRDERLGTMTRQHLAEVRRLFVHLAERAVATGELPPTADARKTGAVLFSLCVFGYYTHSLVMGGGVAAFADGVVGMLGAPSER